MTKPSTNPSDGLSTPFLVGAGVAWGVMALLFFLLFSAPNEEGLQPPWFLVGITILETGAFFFAALLCFRNWKSAQMVSGRGVWFWIGMGLLMYTAGNILFFLWGNIWGLDPAVSLGDFFYILSYIFIAAGMFKAVLPRRLNLDLSQWLIVIGIGVGGVLLALFVNLAAAEAMDLPSAPGAIIQMAQAPAPEPALPPVVPQTSEAAPTWVYQLDQRLESLAGVVGVLYLIGDCVLLVIAGSLLVAFWGGRFSQSWKLIAIAAICLYIADMFFAYAVNTGNYIEGSLWEVFWTFSAVFFGLGAVVEYSVSVNSRRGLRRRKG